MMRLAYHDRVDSTFIDGMHTIKDVVCNFMDVILGNKTFIIRELQLSSDSLRVADEKFRNLVIPKWVDLPCQFRMISGPKNLKSHNWKQVKPRCVLLCLFQLPLHCFLQPHFETIWC